jgi:hypothetical protein
MVKREDGATKCWKSLKPLADELCRLIVTAPISAQEKKFLALLAVSNFMGVAARLLEDAAPQMKGLPLSEITRGLCELIVHQMELEETRKAH